MNVVSGVYWDSFTNVGRLKFNGEFKLSNVLLIVVMVHPNVAAKATSPKDVVPL